MANKINTNRQTTVHRTQHRTIVVMNTQKGNNISSF